MAHSMHLYFALPSLIEDEDLLKSLTTRELEQKKVRRYSLSRGYSKLASKEYTLSNGELYKSNNKGAFTILPPNVQDEVAILVASLRKCTRNKDFHGGTEVHDHILKRGLIKACSDALVTMYAKCGEVAKAKALLDTYKSKDVITWTALIAGYTQEGQGQNALDCFECMRQEGVLPNAVTYACILKACSAVGAIEKGKEIHEEAANQGFLQNVVLGAALVDMYVKCGDPSRAQDVLENLPCRNVFSWSSVIAGYAKGGQGAQALICYELMKGEGILPDAVAYACILRACAMLGAIDKGKQIHDEVLKQGLLKNNMVLGTALLHMYAKCGAVSLAQEVFELLPSRDVVAWSALIVAYAQANRAEETLNCFERMQNEGIPPNAVTYLPVLRACAALGAGDKGKEVHDEIVKQRWLQHNIVLGTALVDMYAKCGNISKARDVLDKLTARDAVSWNALIAGYAQEAQGEQAINCVERMLSEGILPNVVTFLSVLNVCNHQGLLEQGIALFADMSPTYGVKPNFECYTSMVDLFGRAGHLEKAVQLIQDMPSSEYYALWLSLLGACWKWGDFNVGRWAFEQAVGVDGWDGPAYVLMSNIYAEECKEH